MTVKTELPNHGEDNQQQEDAREGEHDVDEAHQHRVDPAPVVPGNGADQNADEGRHDGDADADHERDAGAVDEPAQLVPAQLVGAQPVRGRWRGGDVEEVDLVLAIGCDRVGEDRPSD